MRVTHIITRLIVGGAQENTVDSVLGLRARHHLDVDLISGPTVGPEGSLESAFADLPRALAIAPHLVRPIRPFHDWQALRELTRMLRRRAPRIVHTHSGKAGILGRWAAHRAGVPVIVHTVHGPSFGSFQSPVANRLFRFAESQAAGVTTHFVGVAHAMVRQYLAAGIGHPEDFTYVPSGFALAPFLATRNDPQLRARLGLEPSHFVVGKLARLAPLKGHEDLIAAAPLLVERQPNIRFLVIGDGPERSRFEATLQSRRLQRYFAFTGLVTPQQIPALLGIVDVVVHLSRREGLPRALTQALAAAKPVVAYDCDGAGEVCRTNETGFLVPAGDLRQLIQRISQLAQNRPLCAEFGQNGRARVCAEFSVERMVDDLHTLYRRLDSRVATGPTPTIRRVGRDSVEP